MSEPVTNASDFLRGQQDCQEGNSKRPGQSEDYRRGYDTENVWKEVARHRANQTLH